MPSIKKAHDRFFNFTFSYIPAARAFFIQTLPKDILDKIDLATLNLEKDSFVTKELSEYFSDLVFTCSFKKDIQKEIWEMVKGNYSDKQKEDGKAGEFKLRLCFLLEHKSFLPDNPYTQLGGYLFNLMDKNLKPNGRLDITIPIIFYHGDRKWVHQSLFNYYDGLNDYFKQFVPNFQFILVDMEDFTDIDILAIRSTILRNAFLAFKHGRDTEYVEKNFSSFFDFKGDGTVSLNEMLNFYDALMLYLISVSNLKKEKLKTYILKLPNPVKDVTMTTYNSIFMEGKQKGREEGLEKGREEGLEKGRKEGYIKVTEIQTTTILNGFDEGFSIPLIAKLLNVSEDFVKKILKERGRI